MNRNSFKGFWVVIVVKSILVGCVWLNLGSEKTPEKILTTIGLLQDITIQVERQKPQNQSLNESSH